MKQAPDFDSNNDYAVSMNELSQQRFDQLASAAAKISTVLPEIAGVTVYGSVARGEATAQSDVDLFVLVEPTNRKVSPQSSRHLPKVLPWIIENQFLPGTSIFQS